MDNLRISTCTGIGKLNTFVNLKNLLDNINPIDDGFIRYVETSVGNKGFAKKNTKKKRKPVLKKSLFFNQGTVIVFDKEAGKLVNVKLFQNSKIQVTGILSKEMGIRVVNDVVKYIVHLDSDFCEEQKIFNNNDVNLSDFRLVLQNADFDFGYSINREELYQDLVKEDIFCTYEASHYPGVNIKLFYNKTNPFQTGICNCETPCSGKGKNENECVRITTAVFASGKCLVTGSRDAEQLDFAHNFIYDFVNNNKDKYILR